MLIGLFFLLGACLLAFPLIELRGWPILAIGIPALYFTYGYTGGPWPLAYKGLGEIFVILFFGLVAVLGNHSGTDRHGHPSCPARWWNRLRCTMPAS